MKKLFAIISFFTFGFQVTAQSQFVNEPVRLSIPSGKEKWDYMAVFNKLLFVSHGDRVHVLQLPSGNQVAEFDSLVGVHGIAIAGPFGKGFITNGGNNVITIFELQNFSVIKTLAIPGKKADAILYDAYSKRIFVFNNGSGDVIVIDPQTNEMIGQIMLGGAPEFSVSNLAGSIFNNNEETNEIIEFDANSLAIRHRYNLAPNEVPTGLAIDIKNNRLFSVCRKTKTLVVLDERTGKIVTTLPIGAGVDGVVYDPQKKLIITSNGEGTATVVRQLNPDQYEVVQTLHTAKGQKTIAIDESSNQLFLSGASYLEDDKTPAPGTFGVSVYTLK